MHTSPKAWLIESIVPVQLPVPLLYVMREPGSMQPFYPGLHVLLSQNNTSGYKMGCLQQQLPRIGVWFGRSKHGHTIQLADNVPTWARRGCARVKSFILTGGCGVGVRRGCAAVQRPARLGARLASSTS